jgi:DNA repair exonuclease SbcCD ATPase subunit
MEEETKSIKENIEINSEKKPDDDITFNKLKELQKLLKKESAVKELFVRMKDETKKNIEKQFLEVLTKKMEVFDILQKIKEQTEIKKNNDKNDKNKTKDKNKEKDKAKEPIKPLLKEYCLVENNYDYLSDLNTRKIKKFFRLFFI